MDLWQTLGLLVRFWYVTVVVLGFTGVAAHRVSAGVEPAFAVRADVVVLPPASQLVIGEAGPPRTVAVNPYFFTPASTRTTAAALAVVANGAAFKSEATGGESLALYRVMDYPRNSSLTIMIEAKDRTRSLTTALAVIERLTADLETRQGSAGPTQRLSLGVLAPPTLQEKTTRRSVAVVVAWVVGLLASVLAAQLAHAVARARTQQRPPARDIQRAVVTSQSGDSSWNPPRSGLLRQFR